jgi:hypothetical protein
MPLEYDDVKGAISLHKADFRPFIELMYHSLYHCLTVINILHFYMCMVSGILSLTYL